MQRAGCSLRDYIEAPGEEAPPTEFRGSLAQDIIVLICLMGDTVQTHALRKTTQKIRQLS